MRKKGRSRIAVLLGIGAICGMLGTTGRYVYAENMTTATAAIEESTGDITPATGYEVSENAGPELYTSDEELALQSTSNDTSQSGTWENITWTLSGTTLTISGKGDMPDASSSDKAPWYTLDVEKVVIKSGITKIGSQNFVEMYDITDVTYPNTLKEIGEAAFYGCTKLQEVVLPSSVKTIRSGAYCDCKAVTRIEIPGVTDLGSYAFQNNCPTTFTIPAGVTSISPLVFFGNTTIESYTVAAGNTAYVARNGVVYSKDQSELVMYPFNGGTGSFTIPSNVKKIGDYAFYNNVSLNTVNFSNVTTLGEGAFYMSGLSGTLTLSDKISEAGNFAFQGCTKITTVKFGKGMKESAYSMFEKCTGITSIDFGGLTSLGMRTFLGCNSLVEVTVPATIKSWDGSVFNSCQKLVTFRGMGLEYVTYADFAQCYALTDVYLPKVKEIYRQAFANCPSLKQITLPASTQFVDENAFAKDVVITCNNNQLVRFGYNGFRYAETIQIKGKRDYTKAFEVLDKVNAERAKNGLDALTMDTGLLETAMIRAGEQAVLFSHTRPDGASCFSANKNMNAENVAINQSSATAVMNDWMNSSGHKENILSKKATTIGVGCFYINGIYTWVQCFGSNTDAQTAEKQADRTITQNINIPKKKFTEAITTDGIVWGDGETYSYKFVIQMDKDTYTAGKNVNAKVVLVNPGFSMYCPFTSGNITWSSDKKSVATVDKNGKIAFVGGGKVTITAKTKYHETSLTLTVQSKSQVTKTTPTLTLKNKTVTYTGKGKKIGAASVKGAAGKITYKYYSDSKCTKRLSTYPSKVGTYYVIASAKATATSNSAKSNVAKLMIKKSNPMKVKVASKTYKAKKSTGKLNKKHSFIIGVKNAKGKVTYSRSKASKAYITVSKKGKVTVRKGTPKGTYTITVKAKGTSKYRGKSKKITIKVS
ncbi:leucine-rich repeat protein [Coprococcus eutactus]|uniref:leucine-rich repeat protein n=1 Tax=Coprococcus eutactus TaxID=33043 RepID=UPI001570040B|nr:leucine-rich repeat protein [Coprococcus eutactus]MCB5504685.1 leucine-rich repeat protein [Coprococcus eutactus]NSC96490.1 leucine-rich repeat protein [Coprococcus eutactus]NSD35622.1 leucine-rich repeat protein [Coprococcus eutactus]